MADVDISTGQVAIAVIPILLAWMLQWVLGRGKSSQRRDERHEDRDVREEEREQDREDKRHAANDLATERALDRCEGLLEASRRECAEWRDKYYALLDKYAVRLDKPTTSTE